MITTSCIVCGRPVIVVRHPERATCSARCASESGRLHDLRISHREWLILRNFIADAEPNVPRALRLNCGTVRLVVEVDLSGVVAAEHKAVAP